MTCPSYGKEVFQRWKTSVPWEAARQAPLNAYLVWPNLLPLHSMNERDIEATERAEDNKRTQDLRTQPIPKLLLQYAIPAVVGTVVQALYNICLLYTSDAADE